MIATDQMLAVFVDAADTLVDDFDLFDFLHRVVEHAGAISDTDVVGLLLVDENEHLRFMAGTTAAARSIELFQVQQAEGPCFEAVSTGASVVVPDVALSADRWPAFSPHVLEQGLRSAQAFPMRLRNQTIGALNIFGSEPGALPDHDAQVVQALADVATIGIIQERAIRAAETLTEQLQGALNTRIVIEQAKGAVAQTLGITVEDAFVVLRGHARSHGLRLAEVCRAVTNQELDPETFRP